MQMCPNCDRVYDESEYFVAHIAILTMRMMAEKER